MLKDGQLFAGDQFGAERHGAFDFVRFVILPRSAIHPHFGEPRFVLDSTQGEKVYNVNMAATLLTSMVPLAVYFVSGRWFVRGIAAGAVKG